MNWNLGIVVDNVYKDSSGNVSNYGWIKVKIPQFSNTPVDSIPWFRPVDVMNGRGYGSMLIPPVNSQVLCLSSDKVNCENAFYYYIATTPVELNANSPDTTFNSGDTLDLAVKGTSSPSTYQGSPDNAILYTSPKGTHIEFADFLKEDKNKSNFYLTSCINDGLFFETITKDPLPGNGRRFDKYCGKDSRIFTSCGGVVNSSGAIDNSLIKKSEETSTTTSTTTSNTSTSTSTGSGDDGDDPTTTAPVTDTTKESKVVEGKKEEKSFEQKIKDKATQMFRDGVKKGKEKAMEFASSYMDKAFNAGMSAIANSLKSALGDDIFALVFPYLAAPAALNYKNLKEKSMSLFDQIKTEEKKTETGTSKDAGGSEDTRKDTLESDYQKNKDFYWYTHVPCKYGHQFLGMASNSMPVDNSVGLDISQQWSDDNSKDFIIPEKSNAQASTADIKNGGLFYNNHYTYKTDDTASLNGFTSFAAYEDCIRGEIYTSGTASSVQKTSCQTLNWCSNEGDDEQMNSFRLDSSLIWNDSAVKHNLSLVSSFAEEGAYGEFSLGFKGSDTDTSDAFLKYNTEKTGYNRPSFNIDLGTSNLFKETPQATENHSRDSILKLNAAKEASSGIFTYTDITSTGTHGWYELSMNKGDNQNIQLITTSNKIKDSIKDYVKTYTSEESQGSIILNRSSLDFNITNFVNSKTSKATSSYTPTSLESVVSDSDKNSTVKMLSSNITSTVKGSKSATSEITEDTITLYSGNFVIKVDNNSGKVLIYTQGKDADPAFSIDGSNNVNIKGTVKIDGTLEVTSSTKTSTLEVSGSTKTGSINTGSCNLHSACPK